MRHIPVYALKAVREGSVAMEHIPQVHGADDVAPILLEFLDGADREHFVVVALDTKRRINGLHTAGIGSLNAVDIPPREVFKIAVVRNAAAIIVAHNHPSGEVRASAEDRQLTTTLVAVGRLLEIPVLDHLIVGFGGRWTALRTEYPDLFDGAS